jgi:outer membrane protein
LRAEHVDFAWSGVKSFREELFSQPLNRRCKLKNTLSIIVAAGALVASASTAFAVAPGESILRLRAIQVEPDVSGVNGVDVDGNTGGEIGATGFLSEHWALDLGIGTSKHDVTRNGADAGSVKLMPVNLTLQYHFLPDAGFRPYIGAGGNYTRFYEVRLNGGADVDRDRFGPVAQVGFDIPLGANVLLNLDVKKVWLKTDLSGPGGGELKLDPWVYGVGVGFRF